jgi:hypothetical protein
MGLDVIMGNAEMGYNGRRGRQEIVIIRIM